MGQLQRKNTRKGTRGKRFDDDTVTSQLLEAIFAPHSDRIRAEITKGSPRQVENNVTRMLSKDCPCRDAHELFQRLVVAIEVVEERFCKPGLRLRIFKRVRRIFEHPKFYISYGSGPCQEVDQIRKYINIFLRVQPQDIVQGIPHIIRQHCKNAVIEPKISESMQLLVDSVTPAQRRRFTKLIVSTLLKDPRYTSNISTFAQFAISSMTKAENYPSIVADVRGCLKFVTQHGTVVQKKELLAKVLRINKDKYQREEVAKVLRAACAES